MAKWSELEIEDVKARRQRRKQEHQKKLSERKDQEEKERKKSLLIKGIIALAFMILIGVGIGIYFSKGAQEKMARDITASIDMRSGELKYKEKDSYLWVDLPENYRLKAGEGVQTGKDSKMRFSFVDRDEVALRPNSELEIVDIEAKDMGFSKIFRVLKNDVIFGSSGIGEINEVLTDFVKIFPEKGISLFKVRVNKEKGQIDIVVKNGQVDIADNKQLQKKRIPKGYGISVDFKAQYLTIPEPSAVSMVSEAWE